MICLISKLEKHFLLTKRDDRFLEISMVPYHSYANRVLTIRTENGKLSKADVQ